MDAILEVKDLVKKYDKVAAVDGISFALRQGICFGLLGPNGAGKTTTIEVIEDVIPPTAGEVFYKGAPRTPSSSSNPCEQRMPAPHVSDFA